MSKIFISYRSLDSAKVDSIASKLRAMEDENRNHLYTVWQDKYNIPDGHNWWDAIVDAIIDCDIFVFMVSEEACNSPICQAELRYAFIRNRPIVPIALEGEYFYNPKTAKNDIRFWESVPTELIERQAQFLFYEGGSFASRLANAIHKFASAPHRWQDKEAKRPLDPRDKDDEESDDIFDIYDEAVDYAYRMEFQTAERHFLRLINSTDDTFQEEADKWVDILRAYKDIKKFASRKSMQHRVAEEWTNYQNKHFPVKFIDGIFDPFDVGTMPALSEMPASSETIQNPVRAKQPTPPPAREKQSTQPRDEPVRKTQPTPSHDESKRKTQPTPPVPQSEHISPSSKLKFALPQPFAWIDIPAGDFLYGKDKKTMHLPDFTIGKYPITYAQFQVFVQDKEGFHDSRWWSGLAKNQSKQPGDQQWKIADHPRENVSWYDAIAFCRWLSWRMGGGYDMDKITEWAVRLPTEYEWEKAARGADGLEYPYGNRFDKTKSNTKESGIGKTTPVTQHPQGVSSYGVLDMSGNVWEWCLTDYKNPASEASLENIHSDSSRVLRGGSWLNNNHYARVARRGFNDPDGRNFNYGFRIVRPPSL